MSVDVGRVLSGSPGDSGALVPRRRENEVVWVLYKDDFPEEEYFPPGWDQVLDVHGQGPRPTYLVHLRHTVRRSTKRCVPGKDNPWSMKFAQQACLPYASLRFSTEQHVASPFLVSSDSFFVSSPVIVLRTLALNRGCLFLFYTSHVLIWSDATAFVVSSQSSSFFFEANIANIKNKTLHACHRVVSWQSPSL